MSTTVETKQQDLKFRVLDEEAIKLIENIIKYCLNEFSNLSNQATEIFKELIDQKGYQKSPTKEKADKLISDIICLLEPKQILHDNLFLLLNDLVTESSTEGLGEIIEIYDKDEKMMARGNRNILRLLGKSKKNSCKLLFVDGHSMEMIFHWIETCLHEFDTLTHLAKLIRNLENHGLDFNTLNLLKKEAEDSINMEYFSQIFNWKFRCFGLDEYKPKEPSKNQKENKAVVLRNHMLNMIKEDKDAYLYFRTLELLHRITSFMGPKKLLNIHLEKTQERLSFNGTSLIREAVLTENGEIELRYTYPTKYDF